LLKIIEFGTSLIIVFSYVLDFEQFEFYFQTMVYALLY